MKIESKVKKGILLVKIEGRIDTDTSPELERYLNERIERVAMVEFDFRKVEYISSAGLKVLLQLSKNFGGEKNCIVIERMNDTVRAVFELTGFDSMFVIK